MADESSVLSPNKEGATPSLTSFRDLSAESVTPICLDAIALLSNFKVPKAAGQELFLPPDLSKVFGVMKIRFDSEGRIKAGKNPFTTTGTYALRARQGLPEPVVSASMRNQMLNYEVEVLKSVAGDKPLVGVQWMWTSDSLRDLLKLLELKFGCVYIQPQQFIRFELYYERPITGDPSQAMALIQRNLGLVLGAPTIHIAPGTEGKRDHGEYLAFNWPVPKSLVVRKTKRQSMRVKAYRKGSRLRVEVAFLKVPVPGFRNDHGNPSIDRAIALIDDYAQRLMDAGTKVLETIEREFGKTPAQVDIGSLERKLECDLRMKGVRTNLPLLRMMECLSKEGIYTPADWGELAVKGERLLKLKDSVYGILEEVPVADASPSRKKSYRLRADWLVRPAMPSQ